MTAITPMSTALNAEPQHHARVEGSECGGEQLVRLLATHTAGDGHGTAEGSVGVVGERLIQAGGHDHVRTVDGGENTRP